MEEDNLTEWKLIKETKDNLTFALIENNEESKAIRELLEDGKVHYLDFIFDDGGENDKC